MSHRNDLTLGERLEVEAALESAFEPLRGRQAELSPLRVRAAVRWGRGAPRPPAVPAPAALKWSGTLARLSELSVAVGMGVMLFTAGLGSATIAEPVPSTAAVEVADPGDIYPVPHVTAALEDERYIRWLRIDRYVPLHDWLDPSTVRSGLTKRLDPPAPGTGGPPSRDPY